jgi:hypothetical protein
MIPIYVHMIKGSTMSIESRLKMSLSHIGRTDSRTGYKHSKEAKEKMSLSHKGQVPWIAGKNHTFDTKRKMSIAKIGKPQTKLHIKNMTMAVKLAMRRPDVREKHIKALAEGHWLGQMVDRGQVELLEKWNKLGFEFQPNYKLVSDGYLFFIDGYDPKRNVVLEYDSKYHHRFGQLQKDILRQQKIIDILKPKKFWRYDSVNKTFRNVLEGTG